MTADEREQPEDEVRARFPEEARDTAIEILRAMFAAGLTYEVEHVPTGLLLHVVLRMPAPAPEPAAREPGEDREDEPVPEAEDEDEADPDQGSLGYFPTARRIVGSSLWISKSSDAFKLVSFILNVATDPMNAHPGEVRMTGRTLAHALALPFERSEAAVAELLAPDPDSHSKLRDGAVLAPLKQHGEVFGYRMVNFDTYHPGLREQRAAAKAARKEAARKGGRARGAQQTANANRQKRR